MENIIKPNNNGNGKKKQWRIIWKELFLWLILAFFVLAIFSGNNKNKPGQPLIEEKSLSVILNDIKDKKIKSVEIEGPKINVIYQDGGQFYALTEPGETFIKTLEASQIDPKSVDLKIKDNTWRQGIFEMLGTFLPILFLLGFFFWSFRQGKGIQDSLFSFGHSKAKLYNKDTPKVKFADVAGVDEAKRELEEVVDFLKNPDKYKALGARTPKGVLLVGPSGCGKTLLARAVAGEAEVAFFSMAGSEFMEMLVGVGASRVRDLFNTAKKSQPSIIFIDEVESIGRARSMFGMSSHDEREQTLNQILVEMDGFEKNERVVVMGATNRPDLLDNALMRPGRFDRKVVLDLPDIEGRLAILEIHKQGKTFTPEVDWHKIAKRTVGFSGADLENMLNEAAILTARGDKKQTDGLDLEEAATKVKLGPEKKRLQTDEDKRITAYHEAGHAVVSFLQTGMDPVHRISIVSRGMALGYTLVPPARDRIHETKTHLLSQIAMMLAGRAAEKLIFNEMTTGASSDIDHATKVARDMVMEYGMSSIGPINFGPTQDSFEWGKPWMEQTTISQNMQDRIDTEVKKIVDEAYEKALGLLQNNREKLDAVSQRLVEIETMEGEEFSEIMKT